MAHSKPVPKALSGTNEFAAMWHGTDINFDLLYDGKINGVKMIPDADQRQDELIRLSVDTALETILFLELDNGTTYPQLEVRKIVKKGSKELIQGYYEGEDHSREAKIRLIKELRDRQLIRTHSDLCTKEDMEDYHRKVDLFRAALDDFVEEINEWRDLAIEKPEFPKVDNPKDPRIKNFNKDYDNILLFHDSGAKNRSRTKKKAEEKGAVWQIKDINRLTVVPKTPEIADIFTDLLASRSALSAPQKTATYCKDWSITNTCLVDKKCYVALTEGFENAGKSRALPQGSVGEIKIEGPDMFNADEISHRCYRLTRLLDGENGFNPREIVDEHKAMVEAGEGEKSRFSRLPKNVEKTRNYYTTLGYDVSKLPPQSELMRANANTIKKVYDAVLALNRQLFVKPVKQMAPDNPWKRVWAEAAFKKHAELMNERSDLQAKKEAITDKAEIARLEVERGRVKNRKDRLISVTEIGEICRGMPNPPKMDYITAQMATTRQHSV